MVYGQQRAAVQKRRAEHAEQQQQQKQQRRAAEKAAAEQARMEAVVERLCAEVMAQMAHDDTNHDVAYFALPEARRKASEARMKAWER